MASTLFCWIQYRVQEKIATAEGTVSNKKNNSWFAISNPFSASCHHLDINTRWVIVTDT